MFGHDMSWASFHVLEVMSSPKYLQKRVGYLGAVQSFRPDTDVLMLATNLLKKDITSPLVPTIALPLVTLPHIITSSLALSLLSDLLPRLSHSNPNVRKKTIVALYRLALVYPETLRPAWPKIKDLLMSEEEDSSVTAAVINVVCELGWRRPRDFLPLAPRLFELLVDGGNNWMAIKIIKLFATLTPLEPRLIKKLLPPLATLIRTTPAMSLLYECINGIVQGGILESVDGVREGEEIAALCVGKLRGMIIVEGDPNLKYVALLAFKKIVLSHPDLVSLHQDVIMSCIDDPDISIRLQALDLSAGMVNKENLLEVVNRLLQQLHQTSSSSTAGDDNRNAPRKVEPGGDSDGDDPEQVLRLSKDRFEDTFTLPPEYRLATIKEILDMCTKDTYANISDFEWYIDVLVQLIEFVPPESGSNLKGQGLVNQRSFVQPETGEEVLADIGRELRNVAVRVHSVRPETVNAAASLLRGKDQHPVIFPGFHGGGALPFAAWVVGEYAEQLNDLDTTLNTLISSKVSTLPSTALCAYLQAIPKLFAIAILRASGKWTAERQTTTSLLMARLLYFLEPLTMNPSLEVQERAVELAELVRLASQAVADHARGSDHWPLLLTKAIPQLFGGSDLNPVAPSAQARVSYPHDLDLDVPLNSDLANLLHQVDEKLSSSPEAIDFETFYSQRPDRRTREAEPAVERLPTLEPGSSSYQNTENSDTDSRLIIQKRLERHLKNRDDPFYIAGDQHSSGTSTPFHEIIRSTNGDGVDVDSIPIMNLDLGDKASNNDHSEPEQNRPRTKQPKAYQIATDENIDMDDPPGSLRASMLPSEASSGNTRRAHDTSKRSLLEVDSSGLGGITLEGFPSAATLLEYEKQESDEADMAKALQEVERLRLEMQRASERVRVSAGVSPEGTLVKKKKKKKRPKPSTDSGQSGTRDSLAKHAEDEKHVGAISPNKLEAEAPIVKRKRREPDLERKERLHEYRIAARREKRLRKADEKKQRKLNATILRRMTRNPDKYNKNAERNRLRDIQLERRKIQDAAVKQAQRLAAIHDLSGAIFNVDPVIRQENGSVLSAESIRRRQEREAAKAAANSVPVEQTDTKHSVDAGGVAQIEDHHSLQKPKKLSKAQQRKQAALQPRPPPPKPKIPEGISIPDGEEDWLTLWDLPDDQIERRILRAKRRKAAERKALRVKQQSGKADRREARDEKRKVYRDIKLIWKSIKEDQAREKTRLKAAEEHESKKIAVEINEAERKVALDLCETLGFTIANTAGTEEIKPRMLGMRGREVNFDAIQALDRQGNAGQRSGKRVNLGGAARQAQENVLPTQDQAITMVDEEFIKLDVGPGQDHEALSYNHKLRRKLRRALDSAQVQKEMLVRQRAVDYFQEYGVEPPTELTTNGKPVNVRGVRILENGATETAKQERVRARLDLAEFNQASRVLRKQAKECAIEAGLRKHAELTGRLPRKNSSTDAEKFALPPHIAVGAAEVAALAAAADHVHDAKKGPPAPQSDQTSTEGYDESEQTT
ncbi:MAG: hypothetical protein Q9225_005700 [Loekoesia sp. 1 TL-2023]